MNSANWLPPSCALVLILTGCAGNKPTYTDNNPNGTGPFNSRGEYIDSWADDPSKWRKPGSQQHTDDLPVIAKTEEPPANANPLGTNKPSSREPFTTTKVKTVKVETTKVQTVKVDSTRPKPSTTKPKSTSKPKSKPKATRYVVKKGDSLSAIASRNGSSVSAIRSANGISGTMIRPGQSLLIPKR